MSRIEKKEKNVVPEDKNLNFDELEGLGGDDDLDFGIDEIDPDSRDAESGGVAKELAASAGEGFLDSLVKNTAKKSLPESYSNNYYEAMDYVDFAKETFDRNKSKVGKSMYKFGKEVKKILPFQISALDKYLQNYEEENEEYRSASEEEMRDSSIQSAISSVFDKQLDLQKAIEAKRDAEESVETKERLVNNKLNLDMLTSIDSNIATQTAFTIQIGQEYYKRSLELQFKSYYVQLDLFKVTRDSFKAFSVQFDNVVHNTSLPDFVKMHQTELVGEILRKQTIQNTYNALFSNSKYVEGIKKRMAAMVDEKVGGITEGLDNITDAMSMITSGSEGGSGPLVAIGNMLTNIFGDTIGEKVSEKISPKLKDKIKDNKTINAGANYLEALAMSPSTVFGQARAYAEKKADEYQDESGPGRFLKSKLFGGLSGLLSVTDPRMEDTTIKKENLLTHNKAAIFDNNVHRSITETIPLYLSKILKEATDLRGMYSAINKGRLVGTNFKEAEELSYDYLGRKLDTMDKISGRIEADVLQKQEKKSKISSAANVLLSDTATTIKANKDNPNAKADLKKVTRKDTNEILGDYFRKAADIEGQELSYEELVEKVVTGKGSKGLMAIVGKDEKLFNLLKLVQENGKASKNRVHIDERIKDIKRDYPITGVKELFNGAGKIAGSKIQTILSDKQLEIFAKAFTLYITGGEKQNQGEDLSIEGIISLKCFKHVPKGEAKGDLTDAISLLVSDVRRIEGNGEPGKSALVLLISAVNKSLKEGLEFSQDAWNGVRALYPSLVKTGKLNIRNLVEGKLGEDKEVEYIDLADLKKAVKASKADLVTKRIETSIENVGEAIGKKYEDAFNKFKGGMKEAGTDRKKMVGLFKDFISETIANAKSDVTAFYKANEDNFAAITGAMVDFEDFIAGKGVNATLAAIAQTQDGLNNTITAERETVAAKIKALRETIDKMQEYVGDDKDKKRLEKQISQLQKLSDAKIGAFMRTHSELGKMSARIKSEAETYKARAATMPDDSAGIAQEAKKSFIIEYLKGLRSEIATVGDRIRAEARRLAEEEKAIEAV